MAAHPLIVILFLFLFGLRGAYAQHAVTDLLVSADTVTLGWEPTGTHYIVAHRASLVDGEWTFRNPVSASNRAALALEDDMAFFCVRSVEELSFPDTNFTAAAASDILGKYAPSNLLFDIDIETLGYLDVSSGSITSLAGLAVFDTLSVFKCGDNRLGSLDISVTPDLYRLYCPACGLTNLDVTGCTQLYDVWCYSNALQHLDWSSCGSLYSLHCNDNGLDNLDLSPCPQLHQLYCEKNVLTNLDVNGCTRLRYLWCDGNGLHNLDLNGHTNLHTLSCHNNTLTNLSLNACANLESLHCWSNDLAALDLSDCTKLRWLACQGNSLTGSLVLAASPAISYVRATDNLLTEIVVASTNNLPTVFLYDAGVTIREP